MTSLEEERARILAAYTDDLLADREPTIPAEATALFAPEELARALSTARFLKGLLRPSRLQPDAEAGLRARLVERARAARAAAIARADVAPSLSALLLGRRRAAGLSPEAVASRARLSERELGRLEVDAVPFTDVPPERLLDVAAMLAIPVRQLLEALEREAERWLPRLARRGLQPGLAGFRATGGMAGPRGREAAHREAAEALADYLARLEGLARERGLP